MTPARTLEAGTIGVLAARAFVGTGTATVLARFDRSFYLDVDGEPITIGDNSLHDGPLNLRLANRYEAGLTTALNIEPGQRWKLSSDQLYRSDGLAIDLAKADIWRPDPSPANPDPAHVANGLTHLRHLLATRKLPEEGLICLTLGSPPRTATERAALPHLQAFSFELAAPKSDLAALVQLLGLGPGLTPSGDDLLAGLLIAWRQVGATSASDRLAQALLTAACERTTEISQAHLQAAAKGYGAAPLHHLLGAILNNDRQRLDQALDAAAKIGHSSGFDAIAGVILALTAWLETDSDTPILA